MSRELFVPNLVSPQVLFNSTQFKLGWLDISILYSVYKPSYSFKRVCPPGLKNSCR